MHARTHAAPLPAAILAALCCAAGARAADKEAARAHYETGVARYHVGDFAGALESLTKALDAHPGLPVIHAALAQARHALGDRARSAAGLEKALRLTPRSAEELVARGDARLLAGQTDKAMADFEAALAKEPGRADALLGRGRVQRARGDHAAALREWTAALRSDPKMLIARYNRAQAHYLLKDPREAVDELAYALRRNPRFHLAYSLLGRIFAEKGDLERAMKAYSKALSIQPDHVHSLLGRAALHLRRGDERKAEADLEAATRADPGDYAPYYNRGEHHLRSGRREAAFEDFRKALKAGCPHPPAALAMASAFLQARLWEDAVEAYSQAAVAARGGPDLTQRPAAEQALIGRARALRALDRREKALKDLNEAVLLFPRSPTAWTERAALLTYSGKDDKAAADLRQALSLAPDHVPALLERGRLHQRAGRDKEALVDYDAAVSAAPSSGEARYLRGLLLLRSFRELGRASSDLESASELAPEVPEHHLELGVARVLDGDWWRAIASLDKALALRADPERALYYRALARFELGDRARAVKDVGLGLAERPDSSVLRMLSGQFMVRSQLFAQGVSELDAAIRARAPGGDAHLYRGLAYGAAAQYSRAARDFREAARRGAAAAKARECQAERLMGRTRQAVRSCSEALQADPSDRAALLQRGLAWLSAREPAKAAADLEEAAKLGHVPAGGWLALSLAQAQLRRFKDADRSYRRALSVDPRARLPEVGFGETTDPRADYYARVSSIEDRSPSDVEDAYAYLVRADALHNAGYLDRAVLEYTRAMEIDGGVAAAYLGRGAALADQQSLDAAEQDFRHAARLDPRDPDTHLALVSFLTLRRKYADALKAAVDAMRQHPDKAELYVRAGNIRYFAKDTVRAERNFRYALRQDPKSATANNGIGLCHFARREYPQALERFSRAIALEPTSDRWLRNRAAAYVNMGDFANAAADYRNALYVNTDPDMAEEYRKLIENSQARAPETASAGGPPAAVRQ